VPGQPLADAYNYIPHAVLGDYRCEGWMGGGRERRVTVLCVCWEGPWDGAKLCKNQAD
jgi:hypothetical protein